MNFKGLDKKLLEFIQKYQFNIFIILVSLFALVIRYFFLGFESGDYKIFLKPWTEHLANNGGILGLKTINSNYNVPYLYLLALISYLPVNYLFSIKVVSIIFDFVGAITCYLIARKLTCDSKKSKLMSTILFALVLFNPTVILNSAAWAQCDMIYTSFMLLSLYFMLDEKYRKSFVFFGISFSFKLQAVFLIPLYIILYINKRKFSIFNFFIIPLVTFILYIPSLLVGRPIGKLWSIYFGQINQTKALIYNFPSVYNLLPNKVEFFRKPGLIFTIVLIGIVVLYFINLINCNNKLN